MRRYAIPAVAVVFALSFHGESRAADYKPIVLDPSYNHDRFETRVTGSAGATNYIRHFRAYTTAFDGEDDDNGDAIPDWLGIPHFVACEIKRHEGRLPTGAWAKHCDLPIPS